MSTVPSVPEGFNTMSCHVVVKGASDAIEFYKKAFDATERCRMAAPDGSLMHSELQIGNSTFMLVDENPAWGCMGPGSSGGSPVTLHLYVDDADAVFSQAVAAGGTAEMPITDMFWGDRYGKLKDPFGHSWSIATHKEDLTPEEIGERAAAMFSGDGECPGEAGQ